jgi:hypothetical protein
MSWLYNTWQVRRTLIFPGTSTRQCTTILAVQLTEWLGCNVLYKKLMLISLGVKSFNSLYDLIMVAWGREHYLKLKVYDNLNRHMDLGVSLKMYLQHHIQSLSF